MSGLPATVHHLYTYTHFASCEAEAENLPPGNLWGVGWVTPGTPARQLPKYALVSMDGLFRLTFSVLSSCFWWCNVNVPNPGVELWVGLHWPVLTACPPTEIHKKWILNWLSTVGLFSVALVIVIIIIFFLSTTSFLHTSLSFKNNQAHLTFQGPLVRHGLAVSIAYTTAENQAPTYTEKKLQCSSNGKSSDRSFSKKSNSDSPFLSNPNKCSKRTFYLISQESHLGATCSQFLNFLFCFFWNVLFESELKPCWLKTLHLLIRQVFLHLP